VKNVLPCLFFTKCVNICLQQNCTLLLRVKLLRVKCTQRINRSYYYYFTMEKHSGGGKWYQLNHKWHLPCQLSLFVFGYWKSQIFVIGQTVKITNAFSSMTNSIKLQLISLVCYFFNLSLQQSKTSANFQCRFIRLFVWLDSFVWLGD